MDIGYAIQSQLIVKFCCYEWYYPFLCTWIHSLDWWWIDLSGKKCFIFLVCYPTIKLGCFPRTNFLGKLRYHFTLIFTLNTPLPFVLGPPLVCAAFNAFGFQFYNERVCENHHRKNLSILPYFAPQFKTSDTLSDFFSYTIHLGLFIPYLTWWYYNQHSPVSPLIGLILGQILLQQSLCWYPHLTKWMQVSKKIVFVTIRIIWMVTFDSPSELWISQLYNFTRFNLYHTAVCSPQRMEKGGCL